MSKPIPIILDGDPGHDDAIAWMLAASSPALKILAVTSSSGNQTIEKTTDNALRIMALLGIDAPMAMGATKPLISPAQPAPSVHGESGLDGTDLPERAQEPVDMPAAELMAQVIAASPDPVVLVPTGPLTNIAALLLSHPEVKDNISRISLMGGGVTHGNWVPAAEFNFLADPEGAEAVFQSGASITVLPLDVTHKCYVNCEEIAQLRSQATPQANFAAEMMDGGRVEQCEQWFGVSGSIMHDPAAALYALHPQLFTAKTCWVGVETGGVHSRGKMVTDAFTDASLTANCRLCYDVDRAGFVSALLSLMERY